MRWVLFRGELSPFTVKNALGVRVVFKVLLLSLIIRSVEGSGLIVTKVTGGDGDATSACALTSTCVVVILKVTTICYIFCLCFEWLVEDAVDLVGSSASMDCHCRLSRALAPNLASCRRVELHFDWTVCQRLVRNSELGNETAITRYCLLVCVSPLTSRSFIFRALLALLSFNPSSIARCVPCEPASFTFNF